MIYKASKEEFKINGEIVDKVKDFKYLGRYLVEDNNDRMTIESNLKKARSRWAQVKRVLIREGASPRIMGYFYKAIVQSVLLYGAETWVWSAGMLSKLESFHNKVARSLTGKFIHPDINDKDEWIYPDMVKVREEVGFFSISEYIE